MVPGRRSNPANVRTVEQLLPAAQFAALFPRAAAAYTYTNLLKAVAKFPSVCPEPGLCRKTLATVFAHFEQETAGLVYLEVTDNRAMFADCQRVLSTCAGALQSLETTS